MGMFGTRWTVETSFKDRHGHLPPLRWLFRGRFPRRHLVTTALQSCPSRTISRGQGSNAKLVFSVARDLKEVRGELAFNQVQLRFDQK